MPRGRGLIYGISHSSRELQFSLAAKLLFSTNHALRNVFPVLQSNYRLFILAQWLRFHVGIFNFVYAQGYAVFLVRICSSFFLPTPPPSPIGRAEV